MPATQPSRTGFKRFIASRASSLCNQVIDTSAVALCAADEVIWRYLESSHNSYARLLHKGLTAGPKKDGSAISTTTADAFNELQAGLSIITNEELEGRLVVSPSCTADADDEVQLGRLGRFLTSASVAAALGVDEGIRTLSKTRVGAIIGLPQFVKHDTDACAEWNELHHELSNVADDDDEIVCTPSSSRNLSVSLRPPTTAVGVATTFIKRVVIAAPLSDSALQTLLTVSAYAPLNGEKAASQQATQEASAWNELQSHFSY